jgi:hypothetical protein
MRLGSGEWGTRPGQPLFLRKGQMRISPALASGAIQWFGSVPLAKCTEPLFLRKGQMRISPALASGAIQWFGSVPLAKRTGPFNTMSVVEALRGSSLSHSCDQLSDKFAFQYSKVVQEYATEIGVQLLFVATCVSYRMHSEAFYMMLYAIFTMMDSWTSRSHPRHDVLR